jgi:hypothetical protein
MNGMVLADSGMRRFYADFSLDNPAPLRATRVRVQKGERLEAARCSQLADRRVMKVLTSRFTLAAILVIALLDNRSWSSTDSGDDGMIENPTIATAAHDFAMPESTLITLGLGKPPARAALGSPAFSSRAAEPDVRLQDVRRLAKRNVPRPSAPAEKPTSQGLARGMKRPEELRLNLEGRDIVTIYSTGGVRLGEGLTVDQASRDFWRKVGELAPTFCHPPAAK